MANTIEFKTEDQFQQACVMWFDREFPAWRKMLFSVPNGGERDTRAARLMQATGVKRGVADLILVNYGAIHFIELKINGNEQSGDQILFEAGVTERGHDYFLVEDSLEDFKNLIRKLIG